MCFTESRTAKARDDIYGYSYKYIRVEISAENWSPSTVYSDDAMQLATWHYVYVLCNLASSIELGISKQSKESDAIVCSEHSRSEKWDKNKWHTCEAEWMNVMWLSYSM